VMQTDPPRPLWSDRMMIAAADLAAEQAFQDAQRARLRAHALGARPRVTPQAEIIHHGGASEKVRGDKMVRLMRSKVSLIDKHWRWPWRPLGLRLFRLWPWTRQIALRLLGRGEGASAWPEVWRRRAEWIGGYPRVSR